MVAFGSGNKDIVATDPGVYPFQAPTAGTYRRNRGGERVQLFGKRGVLSSCYSVAQARGSRNELGDFELGDDFREDPILAMTGVVNTVDSQATPRPVHDEFEYPVVIEFDYLQIGRQRYLDPS